MGFLRLLFVWWHGATPGTLLTTWFSGVAAGRDGFGNRYFRSKNGKRRWVLYKGTVDGSRVPAEWHAWLHHTAGAPPPSSANPEQGKMKSWEKDHLPNLSGTEGAYHPSGSLARGGIRAPAAGDYESWRPHA